MVLGVSGHQDIPDVAANYVTRRLERRLTELAQPAGICSLAAGTDQLFAQLLVERSGELRVVIPCHDYATTFTTPTTLNTYRRLLAKAMQVTELDFPRPSEEAFFAAGRRVVDLCDELLAVWDGRPARGLGGTADVVSYAREKGKPVTVLWPKGASRP